MIFYFEVAFRAEAVNRVLHKKLCNQILDLLRMIGFHILIEEQRAFHNSFQHLSVVFVVKGRGSREHLVNQSPKRPPVHGSSVPYFDNHFRRCINLVLPTYSGVPTKEWVLPPGGSSFARP